MIKIKEILIFTNGMTMAFDTNGNQFNKCQGFLFTRRVSDNIRKYADRDTQFYFAKWKDWREKVDFGWFFEKKLSKKKGNDEKNRI